jgi:Tfp pilus assembly protein PilZ
MSLITWLRSIRARREKVIQNAPKGGETVQMRREEPRQQKDPAQPNYPQKRRYKRHVVDGMEIQAKMVFAEIVDLFDLSSGGACIVTTKSVKPGDNIVLRITDENINRPLKCTIIWERDAEEDMKESPGIFHKAGVQFKGLTPDTLIQLKDYMRDSGIPDEKKLEDEYQPSALRFKVYKNDKAVMSYPISYPVKKLSLGGMLVETDREFSVEQRYPMAIYLPQDNQPIKFQGRIASKIPKKNDQTYIYDVGIEFLNLAATDKSKLNKFLALL